MEGLDAVLALAARLQAEDAAPDEAARAAARELAAATRLNPATFARAAAEQQVRRGLVGLSDADRRWFALKRLVAGLPGTLAPRARGGPDRAAAHLLAERALLERRAGRPRLAIWLAHRALARDPGCYKAWYELGRVLQALGRLEEACDAFRLAIEQGLAEPVPHDPSALSGALNNLAILVEGAVGDAVALAMYHKALAVRPDNGVAAYNLALLHKVRGRLAEAEAWLAHAAALRPNDPDCPAQLAIVRAARATRPPM